MTNTEPLARILLLAGQGSGRIHKQMELFDIEVDLAFDLRNALLQLSRRPYDAVLADVEGPANHNIAALIKSISEAPGASEYRCMDVPVIAIADGMSPIRDLKTAKQYGFSGYLHKPYAIEDAIHAVAVCIDSKKDSSYDK